MSFMSAMQPTQEKTLKIILTTSKKKKKSKPNTDKKTSKRT